MEKFKNVTVFDHPLIKHKIAILRDEKTGMKEFRELIEEIATLMTYEAFKDVPTKKVMVKTPLEETEQTVVVEKSIVLVPVLRAGLGMANGVHGTVPHRQSRTYRHVPQRGNFRTSGILLQTSRRR